jgi:hypothetical protein
MNGNQQNAQRQSPGAGPGKVQGIKHAGRAADFRRITKIGAAGQQELEATQ